MKYEMFPVVAVSELEQALALQYGESFLVEDLKDNLSSFLFGDEYVNDSYKRFSFDELEEYTGEYWQNEEAIRITNCVKSFLQDIFPGFSTILIDVSW